MAELARSMGIDDVVRFVPPLRQTELVDWYGAASAVVVPSYNESFGLVAVEAQACGTPVVAYASGGTPEMLIPDTTGILVPERDVASLANAIGTVLDLPQPEYERLSRAARDFVHSHRSLTRSCEELAEHYASV